jgi:hypothetical protein
LPNALQVHEKSGIFVTLTGRPGSPGTLKTVTALP